MNFARRQQYRRLSRAAVASAACAAAAMLGLLAAGAGAATLGALLLLAAVALGMYARRWLALAGRSWVGASTRRIDSISSSMPFGDLGLLAGHLDSLLSDAVVGDRDRRRRTCRKRSSEARDRYRLPLVQPRRDRGLGAPANGLRLTSGYRSRASAVVLVAIVST